MSLIDEEQAEALKAINESLVEIKESQRNQEQTEALENINDTLKDIRNSLSSIALVFKVINFIIFMMIIGYGLFLVGMLGVMTE